MSRRERTALVMIRSFIFLNMAVQRRSLARNKKIEVSHRGKALCAIKRKLKGKIGDDLL